MSSGEISIATWNLGHAQGRYTGKAQAAWQYLSELCAGGVALVQEARPPADIANAQEPKSHGGWSTYVQSYGPPLAPLDVPLRPHYWGGAVEFRVPDIARPGSLAAAQIDLGDGTPLIALSLYGTLRYADQSVLRVACDIMPLFDTALGERVVLGGDLNIHTHSNDEGERRRAGPILAVLESFGLKNLLREARDRDLLVQGERAVALPCTCNGKDCYHLKTHKHSNHRPGAMANNDYLFATKWMADRLTKLEVKNGDNDPPWGQDLSDHAPLVATFDLRSPRK